MVEDGVGRIEMWVGGNTANCAATDTNWMAVTDDQFVDVTVFDIDDSASFAGTLTGEGGSTITQRTREINIQIEGQLLLDNTITRRIEDTIKVRNDYLN